MTTNATRQNESTMDKIKDKLHIGHSGGANDTYNTGGTAEGVSGPHGTRTANALDPRIDSDRDNSRTAGNTSSYGSGTGVGGTTGTGTGYTSNTGATAEGVSGPHGSRVANTLDPRVDSDRDNSQTVGGGAGYGTGGGYGSTTGTTGTGYGSTTGTAGTTGYGSTTGTGPNTGFAGGLSNSTNAGPHESNVANKIDPRVDSDLDHRGNRSNANTGGVFGTTGSHATPGSGTAQNTAGPHNSDWANKGDPRVDSDRDNSTTLGGNRTYAATPDAAKLTPSQFALHAGEPEVLHHDKDHDRIRRHSLASHQERHSGI
ncbi:hypothetical protein B7463_g6525, partial [Scytalidium lignicola]